MAQLAEVARSSVAPRTASARAYLRGGLPQAYRLPDDGFAMLLVKALEEVLDPAVAQLDMIDAYLDPDVAPPEVLDMIMAWLGLPSSRTFSVEVRRSLVHAARDLRRERGTRTGIERLVTLAFPAYKLSVTDSGGTTIASGASSASSDESRRPVVTIASSGPLDEKQQDTVRRVARSATPAGVDIVVTAKERP